MHMCICIYIYIHIYIYTYIYIYILCVCVCVITSAHRVHRVHTHRNRLRHRHRNRHTTHTHSLLHPPTHRQRTCVAQSCRARISLVSGRRCHALVRHLCHGKLLFIGKYYLHKFVSGLGETPAHSEKSAQ
jgi:hypothetical protein